MAKDIDFQTMAKGFALDGRYRFIFSGSLLGVTTFNVALEPTGYLYEEIMYPMDFEEFLWASNVQEPVILEIKNAIKNKEKFLSIFTIK